MSMPNTTSNTAHRPEFPPPPPPPSPEDGRRHQRSAESTNPGKPVVGWQGSAVHPQPRRSSDNLAGRPGLRSTTDPCHPDRDSDDPIAQRGETWPRPCDNSSGEPAEARTVSLGGSSRGRRRSARGVMDTHTLELLEFDKVRALVAAHGCLLARQGARRSGWSRASIPARSATRQALTTEMADALGSGLTPPFGGLHDIRPDGPPRPGRWPRSMPRNYPRSSSRSRRSPTSRSGSTGSATNFPRLGGMRQRGRPVRRGRQRHRVVHRRARARSSTPASRRLSVHPPRDVARSRTGSRKP